MKISKLVLFIKYSTTKLVRVYTDASSGYVWRNGLQYGGWL